MSKLTSLAQGLVARIRNSAYRNRIGLISIAGIGIILAIAVRVPLLDFKSLDFYQERTQSFPLIQSEGFSALAHSGSAYNPTYFYFLFLVTRLFPWLPMAPAVKMPAMVMDFVCAFFVYRIARLKYERGWVPIGAGLAVLFAPTVVANSAFWGNLDSMHTAGLVACVYFLLKRQNVWALLAFGFALSMKLQAVFLGPLLLALFLRGQIPWKPFLLVPVVLIAMLVPAWLGGRPLTSLLTMYASQTSMYETITMNAPSLYAWVPDTKQIFSMLYLPSLMLAAGAAFALVVVIYKAPREITQPLLLELALLTVLVVPFFLPKMHERYFYPADVLSIAFAMYYPQFFYVPLAVIGVSSLSYLPFLFNVELVPLPALTFVLLVIICVLAYHSIHQLYAPALATESSIAGTISNAAEPAEAA